MLLMKNKKVTMQKIRMIIFPQKENKSCNKKKIKLASKQKDGPAVVMLN